MNITVRNEYRIEVLLSESELFAYGISYEELDYSQSETRRVLWTLADDIKRLSGTDFSLSGKLLIEVMREAGGNTRICFTQLTKEKDSKSMKQLVKHESTPVAAELCDIEEAIALSEVLTCECDSILFERGGRYIIAVSAPLSQLSSVTAVLAEYGSVSANSRLTLAECEEMWNCIIPRKALCRLRQVFSESQQQPFCHP